MAETATPYLSIIVPCRNERAHIEPFLNSVLAQDFQQWGWELIIADGLSNDGTREILARTAADHPNLRVVDNEKRTTPAALNRAIRASRGQIILRMDVHTEYATDYVRACVETLLSTGAQNVGGPARTKADGYLHRAIAAAYHSGFACGGALFHKPDYEGPVDTVTYGCWWKQTLVDLGMFDEDLIRNQDDELNYRIVKSGGKIWQTPKIQSWYKPRPTLAKLWRQYFQYGFWKTVVLRKHGTPASLRQLIPATFLLSLILLPLLGLAGTLLEIPILTWIGWGGFAAAAGMYILAALAATLLTARRYGADLLPVLPAVFATYHFSYGSGFLVGLMSGRAATDGRPKAVTELTR